MTKTGGYGEFRLTVARPLTVLLGGRVSRIENDIARPASGVAFSQTFTPVDGRVGAVLTPRPGVSIYGQYGTGAEPVDALVILGPESGDFELARSNMWEGGIKTTIGHSRVDLTAAVYRIVKTNLTTTDPNDATRSVQIGEQSSRGVELSALVRPSERWLIETNLSTLDARYDLFFEGLRRAPGTFLPTCRSSCSTSGRRSGRRDESRPACG